MARAARAARAVWGVSEDRGAARTAGRVAADPEVAERLAVAAMAMGLQVGRLAWGLLEVVAAT